MAMVEIGMILYLRSNTLEGSHMTLFTPLMQLHHLELTLKGATHLKPCKSPNRDIH
jgi:hypothetical protein